jgi:hypothetical protein
MTHKTFLLAGGLLAGIVPWSIDSAGAQTLDIELNKLENLNGQCAASLLLTNRLSETLDQVRFDLYIFGRDGVIVRRLLLDTGPMQVDKTTVATFALIDRPCDAIGRLLVSGVPICKGTDGSDIDCAAALNLTSRAAVPLTK